MRNGHIRKQTSMKSLPAEFFLPPQTTAGLWQETVKLVAGAYIFIFVLAVLVALTHGVVITV